MAKKIIYKNHCTPQEQVNFSNGNRYYLDSDCGRKLTGSAEPSVTIATTYYGTGTMAAGATASLESAAGMDFVFVKNTGANSLAINISGVGNLINLNAGESFASQVDSATDGAVGSSSQNAAGVSTTVALYSQSGTAYEYFMGAR